MLDHANEARAESVLDDLQEVVFQADEAGHWVFLNAAWETLTGFPVAASLGRSCFDYVHPEDRERKRELLRPLVRGELAYCRQQIRFRVEGADLRWVDVFAHAIVDQGGAVTGIAGILSTSSLRAPGPGPGPAP
ncbi:PAS domain-containing protein [Massilia sp. IC2-477]|uniref:PAS domain-containing protein n=1 Tax=Massilia sp. IC2-477 TaxID=2887198 RepID=UPI001D0FCAD7|nr:PAS domain-containing protein [Massilia sp. IC2-477]MCC2958556.1 PAS domain-containing protein [Massilia sp. IC2-477]